MSSAHRPFALSHGGIEHTILVPTTEFFKYAQLKEQFAKSLPEATESYASDTEPASPAELFA